jgi:hypothetical protein
MVCDASTVLRTVHTAGLLWVAMQISGCVCAWMAACCCLCVAVSSRLARLAVA